MAAPDDGPAAVDLWTLPEPRVAQLAARLGGLELLTSEERGRYERLRRPGSRRRFLGGRLLSRLALSSRAQVPPDSWQFRLTRNGRPEPVADHGLRFNLSHTGGLIVCVVARGRACGVDVERVPFDPDKARHIAAYFDKGDRFSAPGLGPAERWLLTEAYLKGLGVGLADGPGGLHFRRGAGGRFTVSDRRRPATSARWRLTLLRPSPGHLVAVATDGGANLRLREPTWGPQPTSSPAARPAARPVAPPVTRSSRKEDLSC